MTNHLLATIVAVLTRRRSAAGRFVAGATRLMKRIFIGNRTLSLAARDVAGVTVLVLVGPRAAERMVTLGTGKHLRVMGMRKHDLGFYAMGAEPHELRLAATRSAAGTGDTVDWPDDAAFEAAWATLDAYATLKPAQIEMILRSIEAALRSSKSESITINESLTIEHVMPQSWMAHWPLPVTGGDDQAAEARNDSIHDFGNLTLLTQTLNVSVSNGPGANKLPEIAKLSTLILNAYFQERTTWTEKDILDRGAALFQTAKKVWPRP